VKGITGAVSVAAGGGGAACALSATGEPWCWGSAIVGEHERSREVPLPVPWLTNARLVFGGGNHCRLRQNELACWGYNHGGGAGIGVAGAVWTPRHVDVRAVDVALGNDFGCAIAVDDTIVCWGKNDRGQLGTGNRVPRLTPVRVAL